MPSSQGSNVPEKIYSSFCRGLITESTPLTYPEDASYDEDNLLIYNKGNRTRRLGVDYDWGANPTTISGLNSTTIYTKPINGFVWKSPNGDSSKAWYVIQIGTDLRFYDLNAYPVAYISSIGIISVASMVVSGTTQGKLSFASGMGALFCAGDGYEPFRVSWDGATITLVRIYVQIRDLTGLQDGLSPEDEPSSLTATHHYNLLNQGWFNEEGTGSTVSYFIPSTGQPSTHVQKGEANLNYYKGHSTFYPPNNKVWWESPTIGSSKAFGNQDVDSLRKTYFGSANCARGHYVLNAFNMDYTSFSGVSGLTAKLTKNRPVTIGFYAGRVWYAVGSTVYFSQVIKDQNSTFQAGMCYQENDPTVPDINQLLASDGGVIQIPEMEKCIRLFPLGSGILCLSTNGVWFITGTSAGFSATDFTISKISPIGCDSPNSVVEVDGEVYWFSLVGIQGLSQKTGIYGPSSSMDKLLITDTTIRKFYNSLSDSSRKSAQAMYDPSTNSIQWLIQSATNLAPCQYDRSLNYNLTAKAFYPWTFSSSSVRPYIAGCFQSTMPTRVTGESDRYVSYLKYYILEPGSDYSLVFGAVTDTFFTDWFSFEGVNGYTFNSFLETGYQLAGDAMRKKQIPYLMVFFRRTERAFELVTEGNYELDYPSSCTLTTKWDFTGASTSNRWSTPIQVYRLQSIPDVNPASLTLNNDFPVVSTRHKLRGYGKAFQMRFECNEIQKDFDLYGWAVWFSGNPHP